MIEVTGLKKLGNIRPLGVDFGCGSGSGGILGQRAAKNTTARILTGYYSPG
jgi:hypothetical protein